MRLKLIWLSLLCSSLYAQGVSSSTARRIVKASGLPTTCTIGDVYFKTTSTVGIYECLTANNWTLVPTSSGSPGGSTTQIQFNNSGVFGGSSNFTWDSTTGLSVGKPILQSDQGDTVDAAYLGTSSINFTNPHVADLVGGSIYTFAHSGSDNNYSEAVSIVLETPTSGDSALQVTHFGQTSLAAAFGLAGNSTSSLMTSASAFSGQTATASTGNITNASVFRARDHYPEGGVTGRPVNQSGFRSDDLTMGTVNYGFLSEQTAGVNNWAFYSSGTAATKLGSTVFASLLAYANAAEVYCADCAITSGSDNTCAAAGAGAFAQRINGVWKCYQ